MVNGTIPILIISGTGTFRRKKRFTMKDPRRTTLLVIALFLTGLGGTQAIALGNEKPFWTILMRAGIALLVVWLAMPELSRWSFARSWQFVAGSLFIGVVLVTRPKLVLFAFAAIVAALLVNFVLKRVAQTLVSRHRPK